MLGRLTAVAEYTRTDATWALYAASTYGSTSYSYDANGCMVSRTGAQGHQTIKYDPLRRPVQVTVAGQTDPVARFAYDGDSLRRKRVDAKGTIHYVFPWYERNVGNGADTTERTTKYLSALGRTIAVRTNGTLYWLGTDHLGSTIRTADASFTPVEQQRYTPWGESREAGTNLQTDHKFTSQIEDASIGLYWYRSRAYDPVLGRFVCPDTLVPGAANPQNLNRYSYGLNNPVRYADPSGHSPWDRLRSRFSAPLGSFGPLSHIPAPKPPAAGPDLPVARPGLPAIIDLPAPSLPPAGPDLPIEPVGLGALIDPVSSGMGLDVLTAERTIDGETIWPTEHAARREAFRRRNISTSEANNFERRPEYERETTRGPSGEPYETVIATDLHGRRQEIQHHKWGHVYYDQEPPATEMPYYHGPEPEREHIWYVSDYHWGTAVGNGDHTWH